MKRKINILIADDHPIVLAGIKLLIDSNDDFELAGEAENRTDVIQEIKNSTPDILVMDLWLGQDNGLDLLKELLILLPDLLVLMYSMNDENLYGIRSIHSGAMGYLMKDRGLEELEVAIRKVMAGHRYLSSSLMDELLDHSIRGHQPAVLTEPDKLSTITDRELHVLRLIGQGYSTGEIAKTLGVSPKTVGAHREHLKVKLGVTTSEQLIREAITCVEYHSL